MQEQIVNRIRQWDAYLVIGLYGYNGRSSFDILQEAILGGVKVVQIREKKINDEEFIRLASSLRKLCREKKVDFIVNDRVQAAVELDADGVHVGQDDMPGSEVRKSIGNKILGISASSIDEAKKALAQGADYLGVGSIYPTQSKADAGEAVGTVLIQQIREFTDIPIVGIGGIDERNASEVIRAGAESVAVISAICHADNAEAATRKLIEVVESARQ